MNKMEIFQAENGAIEFRGDSSLETIWANQKQIAELFGTKVPAINKHKNNILADEELDISTISKMETVQKEGKREVKRELEFYNLDMIIAIGYRVNSKVATQFRKWSSSILKKYLIDGYAINEKKLTQTKELLNNLKATIDFLSTKEIGQEKEILSLLKSYTKTLSLLEGYDKNNINEISGNQNSYKLEYTEVKSVLAQLQQELMKKGEATQLFANEKAMHLLYFIIKDHPFNDGNKRSAAFLFIYFLENCDYLYKANGEKKINENALVTLTLLIASSNPNEKEILVKLIKHLIFEEEL